MQNVKVIVAATLWVGECMLLAHCYLALQSLHPVKCVSPSGMEPSRRFLTNSTFPRSFIPLSLSSPSLPLSSTNHAQPALPWLADELSVAAVRCALASRGCLIVIKKKKKKSGSGCLVPFKAFSLVPRCVRTVENTSQMEQRRGGEQGAAAHTGFHNNKRVWHRTTTSERLRQMLSSEALVRTLTSGCEEDETWGRITVLRRSSLWQR